MTLIHSASIPLAILWCTLAFSSAEKYAGAEEFLLSIPHASVNDSSIAMGDLNGDNRSDLAIVVQTEPEAFKRYNQLHVLMQDESGQYTHVISSKKSLISGMGCCWLESIEIKNGSIYLQNNAKTSCEMEMATHQFKLYQNTWRLIGLKISNYHHCDEPQLLIVRDINILTGKIIDSKQVDDAPKVYEYKKFSPEEILLDDYDFFHGFGAPEE